MAQKIISQKTKHATQELIRRDAPTPFYLLDLDAIREKIRSFDLSAKHHFPNCEIAYSIKSNNLRAVLSLIIEEGWSAEAVSLNELVAAVEDGFDFNRLLFDGPVKSDKELRYCVRNRIRLQVDSLQELARVLAISAETGIYSALGLRLTHTHKGAASSRFGLAANELREAAKMLARAGQPLCGVHIHAGSNMLQPAALLSTLREHASFIQSKLPAGGWIDLGGGFPANSASISQPSPTIDFYLKSLSEGVQSCLTDSSRWKFIFEPGRFLVEDDGYLATRVSHSKARGGRPVLVCDAGVNQAISINTWAHRIECVDDNKPMVLRNTFNLAGSNCFESDFLGGVHAVDVKIDDGDALLIRGCGSYDIVSANAWIRPAIAIYGIRAGELIVLRHPATQADFRINDAKPHLDSLKLIDVQKSIYLQSVTFFDAQIIHQLVIKNKQRLSRTLHWPRYIESYDDTFAFCQSVAKSFGHGDAVYKIVFEDEVVGVLSFNSFDFSNGAAEIGYWIDADFEGRGIITLATRALIAAYAKKGIVRRFVIKCSTQNLQSCAVAERLAFTCEGTLQKSEKVGEEYFDQRLYAFISN